MSSAERILLWIVVLIFAGGVIYALVGAKERNIQIGEEMATTSSTSTASQLPNGWVEYRDDMRGFQIAHPSTYSVNTTYHYPGYASPALSGVAFVVPASYATGTNLVSDSYVSMEQHMSTSTADCGAGLFISERGATTTITENGTTYSFAEATGAAAGNRYEEQVYALATSSPCTAIRYFIHSTAMGNYEPGTVREFSRDMIMAEFDEIRRSVRLLR